MDVLQTSLKTGITRTPEFERKGLAEFAVNVGTKCGHYVQLGIMCSIGGRL